LSIKLKITLGYVVLMVILCAVLLASVIAAGDKITEDAERKNLVSVVQNSLKEIEWDDGEIEIDDDLELYNNGVYLLIYTANSEYIVGYPPNETVKNLPLTSSLSGIPDGDSATPHVTARIESAGTERYLVADVEITFKKHDSIWLRGAVSLSGADYAISSVTKTALLAFPILVILSAILGYFMTKRALSPVVKITETAKKITESGDLSARINLQNSNKNDEIANLAATFDGMLEKVETAFDAEKQFTSDASHELRTPVAVITSTAEYALDLIEKDNSDDGEIESALFTILKKSQRMSHMISQLLTLARADRGTEKLTMEKVNLTNLAESTAVEFAQSPLAIERNIEITTNCTPDIQINGDKNLLTRMLENLISNALKFNKENGSVTISVTQTPDAATIKVTDAGIGIPPSDLPKIFDRFYQSDKARTNSESAGLGLSMVKWIAESAHKGKITAASTEAGTEFEIELPKT